MKKRYNFIIFIYVLLRVQVRIISSTSEADYDRKFGRIIHVSVIFRHGDRAPVLAYPRDPYSNYTWPLDGYGQLTQKGKQRAYELGKWFQKRYKKLIEKISSHTNISVQSSDKDRTIMSAQLLLAGLYLTKKDQMVEKNLSWHPIPVHTVPSQYDNMLALSRKCSMVDQLIEKSYAAEKLKKLYDKYARTMRYLQKHSGYEFPRQNMAKVCDKVVQLYDTLCIERKHGLKLPSWTKKIFPRKLSIIKKALDYQGANNYKVRKLYSGPLIDSLTSKMKRKINGTSRIVFDLYSGHDYGLVFFMITLGIHNNIDPPYLAALIFELRETKLHEKIVTVFYKNSTNALPYFLEIPKCKSPCKFENFLRITKRFIPTNWEEECRIN